MSKDRAKEFYDKVYKMRRIQVRCRVLVEKVLKLNVERTRAEKEVDSIIMATEKTLGKSWEPYNEN